MKAVPVPYHLNIALLGDDLTDHTDSLKQVLEVCLQKAKKFAAHPDQPKIHFSVTTNLTGDFEGFAAQYLLDQYPNTILNVVLPCTVEECKEHLIPKSSAGEFDALLQAARWPITLEPEPIYEKFPPQIAKKSLEQALTRSVRFLIDHCDLLIAQGDISDSDSGYQ